MHAPIVLKERGEVSVVSVGQYQRAIRNTAAQSNCKQQIVVVNAAVAVPIEIRKVCNQLDATLLKNFQIEIRLNALNLAAEIEHVLAAHHRERIAKLKTTLFRLLRHAERRAVLNARKRELWSNSDRQRVVAKSAEAEVELVYVIRREGVAVIGEQAV